MRLFRYEPPWALALPGIAMPFTPAVPWWAYVAVSFFGLVAYICRLLLYYRLFGKALDKVGAPQVADVVTALTHTQRPARSQQRGRGAVCCSSCCDIRPRTTGPNYRDHSDKGSSVSCHRGGRGLCDCQRSGKAMEQMPGGRTDCLL